MTLDSKQPRTVLLARAILLHLCVSAFRLSWTIRPDSWLRSQEAISKWTHARCRCNISSFACSLLWGKKCLTDCSHYSIQCILTGACPLKKKIVCFVLFCFKLVFVSYCWPTLKSPANHWAIGFFPLCSLPLYHVPQISFSLSYSFSSWTSFIIIIFFFFFFFLL